jgi:2-hydroxychromene-2-carboxylate isomerase
MRGALLALDDGKLVPYSKAVFEAYWGDLLDISQDDILGRVAESVGYRASDFLARIADPAVKARLKANTDELIARGGFGSPTMFVDRTDMYFGNDRLPLVEAALSKSG